VTTIHINREVARAEGGLCFCSPARWRHNSTWIEKWNAKTRGLQEEEANEPPRQAFSSFTSERVIDNTGVEQKWNQMRVGASEPYSFLGKERENRIPEDTIFRCFIIPAQLDSRCEAVFDGSLFTWRRRQLDVSAHSEYAYSRRKRGKRFRHGYKPRVNDAACFTTLTSPARTINSNARGHLASRYQRIHLPAQWSNLLHTGLYFGMEMLIIINSTRCAQPPPEIKRDASDVWLFSQRHLLYVIVVQAEWYESLRKERCRERLARSERART